MFATTIFQSLIELLVEFLLLFGSPNAVRQFIVLTYTGLSEGALLALIALGLVLIFKSTDVINFAHGEFMLLGAYLAYEFMDVREVPLVPSLLLVIVVMVAAGVAVERLILRRLIGEPVISVIMVTIGLSSLIDALVGAYWGLEPKPLETEVYPTAITSFFSSEAAYRLEIEGARRPALLQYENIYTILIVVGLVALFILFFRRSKEGVAMRATADDQQAAMSMGISISRVFAFAWSIAAVTAGAAGLIIANVTQVSHDVGGVGLRAFPVIILGGLDSIPGAIVGGIMIGLIEQYISGYVDPSLKGVVPYLVLLAVLMVRPYGLFGEKRIERV
jgi:branched-chain amino acid transport system permease protein